MSYIYFEAMNQIKIQKSTHGWIIELPDDFAKDIGVEKGSIAVLYGNNGKVETEIISPPTPELEKSVNRIYDKYKDAFAEMKRLGD